MIQRLTHWPAGRWLWVAIVAALGILTFYLLTRTWRILTPFIIGLILAWVILPAVRWLAARLVRLVRAPAAARLLSVLVVYAVTLLLIAGFVYFVAPVISAEAEALLAQLPRIAQSLFSYASGLVRWYLRVVPQQVRSALPGITPSIESEAATLLRGLLGGVTGGLRRVLAVFLELVIVPFWLIYVLYDFENLRAGVLRGVPPHLRADVANLGHIADRVASAYVRGQLVVAVSTGVLTGIVLGLLGVDFAFLLGFLTAVLDLIPTFGPILAGIPVVIIAAIERPILALWALLAMVGVRELEDLLLGPTVVGRTVRIRPALMIVLLIAAGYVWGILGLFLTVPLAAVLRDVLHYLYLRTWREGIGSDEALQIVEQVTAGGPSP